MLSIKIAKNNRVIERPEFPSHSRSEEERISKEIKDKTQEAYPTRKKFNYDISELCKRT